jgi:hypothetical protein
VNGSLILIAGAAFTAWYFGAGAATEVEDTVTQSLQPDAYTQWDSLCKQAASRWGVPNYGPLADAGGNLLLSGGPGWWLMKAICWQESNLGRAKSVAAGLADPGDVDGSVSSDGLSWGLWQVTEATAGDFRAGTTAEELNNPDLSAELAARILARNAQHFPGNLEYIVRSYNGGLGFLHTRRGLEDTPIYWQSVLKKLQKIEAKGG